MRISSRAPARSRVRARGTFAWRYGEMQVGEPRVKPPLTCTAPTVTCIAPTSCPRQGSLTCISPRQKALTCILTQVFLSLREPIQRRRSLLVSHVHLPDVNGLPLCGSLVHRDQLKSVDVWPRTGRLSSTTPTCKWCKKIQAGKHKPADLANTRGRYGLPS